MDIKVIKQTAEQTLKEIEAERPQKFTVPKVELYGVFKTVDGATAASEETQKKLLFFKASDRQKYVDVIRRTILKRENLEMIPRLSVEKTKTSNYKHKLIENRLAAEKTPGTEDLSTEAMTGDNGLTLVEYCPFGVIRAITPTADPTETIINDSISMIAGGSTVMFSPHLRAKKVSQMTIKLLNKALTEGDAPEDLITMVEEPSTENTSEMIENPSVRLLVATGRSSTVKKVLSSGKKAIDTGADSPPVVVDETADTVKAAKDIMGGYGLDNNAPCIAEREVFAVDSICDYLIHNMRESGACQITNPALLEKPVTFVANEKGGSRTSFVGRSTRYISDRLDIIADASAGIIIMEIPEEHLLVREGVMMPILPAIQVCNVDTTIECIRQAEYGDRHTTITHSGNVRKLSKMAKIMEITISVKNIPSYAGTGVGGEGCTTFTIAEPTGGGLTSLKAFCRKRKCVITDVFGTR